MCKLRLLCYSFDYSRQFVNRHKPKAQNHYTTIKNNKQRGIIEAHDGSDTQEESEKLRK